MRAASDGPAPGAKLSRTVRHLPPLGAIAQLGERLDRTQEVAGSSPASSTRKAPGKPKVFRYWGGPRGRDFCQENAFFCDLLTEIGSSHGV
jgi:hypothetical protein